MSEIFNGFSMISSLFFSADIEKRKSFADMKMADIALGGQDWNFSSKESSNHKKSADADLLCNGHEEDLGGLEMASSKKKKTPRTPGSDVPSDVNTPTKKAHPSSAEAEKLNESNGSGDGGLPNFGMGAGTPGTPAQRKPDPVHEICPEMQVKIADLGNACWVVSLKKNYNAGGMAFACVFGYEI